MIQMISSQDRSLMEVGTHSANQRSTLIQKDLLMKKMLTLKEEIEVAEMTVMYHSPEETNEMAKKKDKAFSNRCYPRSPVARETIHHT